MRAGPETNGVLIVRNLKKSIGALAGRAIDKSDSNCRRYR
jgi:hypothetical protein